MHKIRRIKQLPEEQGIQEITYLDLIKGSESKEIIKKYKKYKNAFKEIKDYFLTALEQKVVFAKETGIMPPQEIRKYEELINIIRKEKDLKKSTVAAMKLEELMTYNFEGKLRTMRRTNNTKTFEKILRTLPEISNRIITITEYSAKEAEKMTPEEAEFFKSIVPTPAEIKRAAKKEQALAKKDYKKTAKKSRTSEKTRQKKPGQRKKRAHEKPEVVSNSEMARIVRGIESTPKIEKYLNEVMLARRKQAEEQVKREMGKPPSKHDLIKQAMRDKNFRSIMSEKARKRGYGSVEKYVDAILSGKESKVPSVARELIETLSTAKKEEERTREILAKDEAYQAAKRALESHKKALEQAEAGMLQALLKRTKKGTFSKSQKERIRRLLRRGRKR